MSKNYLEILTDTELQDHSRDIVSLFKLHLKNIMLTMEVATFPTESEPVHRIIYRKVKDHDGCQITGWIKSIESKVYQGVPEIDSLSITHHELHSIMEGMVTKSMNGHEIDYKDFKSLKLAQLSLTNDILAIITWLNTELCEREQCRI